MKDLKPKYFLYARKSTEDDDHQIMSIEAQLFELREYARKENIEILQVYPHINALVWGDLNDWWCLGSREPRHPNFWPIAATD